MPFSRNKAFYGADRATLTALWWMDNPTEHDWLLLKSQLSSSFRRLDARGTSVLSRAVGGSMSPIRVK